MCSGCADDHTALVGDGESDLLAGEVSDERLDRLDRVADGDVAQNRARQADRAEVPNGRHDGNDQGVAVCRSLVGLGNIGESGRLYAPIPVAVAEVLPDDRRAGSIHSLRVTGRVGDKCQPDPILAGGERGHLLTQLGHVVGVSGATAHGPYQLGVPGVGISQLRHRSQLVLHETDAHGGSRGDPSPRLRPNGVRRHPDRHRGQQGDWDHGRQGDDSRGLQSPPSSRLAPGPRRPYRVAHRPSPLSAAVCLAPSGLSTSRLSDLSCANPATPPPDAGRRRLPVRNYRAVTWRSTAWERSSAVERPASGRRRFAGWPVPALWSPSWTSTGKRARPSPSSSAAPPGSSRRTSPTPSRSPKRWDWPARMPRCGSTSTAPARATPCAPSAGMAPPTTSTGS